MTPQADVVVVGGGLAGLSAAVHLHRAGLAVTICEAGDEVGGRVRTDRRDGFLLDRGFQVVLPAYPELRRQVDLSALRLRPFLRGTLAMTSGGPALLAGPWHGRRAVAGTADFLLGHPGDSLALTALSLRDMLAPDQVIRATDPAATTLQDLRGRVGQAALTEVLRPFLAGVFLDPSLDTPARLFHLIWRCFLRGGGALPADGMQTLPRLLADGLPTGTVRTATEVTDVTGSAVRTNTGQEIQARAVVIATDGTTAAALAPGLAPPAWHPVTTFYYRLPASPLGAPVLVIDGRDELLLNAAVPSDVAPRYAPAGVALAAASVPGRADPALEPRVRSGLARMYDTSTRDWELLDVYAIPRALPVLAAGQPLARPVRLGPGRYVCGDHRDTPSIQGALVSGRRAARAVLADLGPRKSTPGPSARN
jgi:phytoene dehydrogenase-like protein